MGVNMKSNGTVRIYSPNQVLFCIQIQIGLTEQEMFEEQRQLPKQQAHRRDRIVERSWLPTVTNRGMNEAWVLTSASFSALVIKAKKKKLRPHDLLSSRGVFSMLPD